VKRYQVRYLPEATAALRESFVFIQEESGPSRAADWLRRVYASIDDLEASPRATQDEGAFDGRELRSKLVISHRVFFTIGEAEQMVYVIDVVHTAHQGGLDTYRDDQ